MSRKKGQADWRRASLPDISDQAETINIDEVPNSSSIGSLVGVKLCCMCQTLVSVYTTPDGHLRWRLLR